MYSKNSVFITPQLNQVVFQSSEAVFNVVNLAKNYHLTSLLSVNYNKNSNRALRQLNRYVLKSFSIHWVRVAFRGKGFRLRKFKLLNKLTLNFGHSHWAKMGLNTKSIFFKKIKRQNYICLIKSFLVLKLFKKTIKTIKKLNPYTKRGLRLKRQFVFRRFGKVSQVVSSLH